MFAQLGRFAFKYRRPILIAYLVFFPVAAVLGQTVLKKLRAGGFEDPAAQSWQVASTLENELKVGSADVMAIYTTPSGNIDDVEMLSAVLGVIAQVEHVPGVVQTVSYYTHGAPQLVSKDRKRTMVVLSLHGDDQAKDEVLTTLLPLLEAPGFAVQLGGFTPFNRELNQTLAEDLRTAELLAFPITLLLLIAFFGSAVSALIPLALGVYAVVLALFALRVLVLFVDISIFSTNIVSVLGLGLAIDYSLFLVNRAREEIAVHGVEEGVARAMATTGRAIAFSGVTVAVSLCGLFAFPQMFLRSMAWGGIAVTLGSLLLALTLLPALIGALGPRLDMWRVPFVSRLEGASLLGPRFWHVLAERTMARAPLVIVAVVVPLVMLAMPFARIEPSIPDLRILPLSQPSRVAMDIVNTEFLAHQAAPLELLIRCPQPVLTRESLEELLKLQEHLEGVPGVASVLSVLMPHKQIGRERLFTELLKPADQLDETVRAQLSVFARDRLVRFSVVTVGEFNERSAVAVVHTLRALQLPPGYTLELGGVGAILVDLKECIRERAPVMVGFVFCVMFIVLFLVFGSVTLPFKAMIMNSLSLTTSYGAMVWIFQDGRFADVLNYTRLGITDATIPLLMFAVVFGLSMDYEVLLLSRVREEYLKTNDNTLAVARGLAHTGRLITSAALLLVVVIGAFATSRIVFMKSLGVGMALAIGLDATIIRAILVPATMQLMGKWNWWAPAPLLRLWKRAGLSDLHD